jgi:drug/metabolite transporter (DMT)-like permease
MNSAKKLLNNPYFLMIWYMIFGGSFAAVGKLTLKNINSYQMLFYIFGVAAVFLTVIFFANGKLKELRSLRIRDFAFLIGNGLFSFMYYAFYSMSLSLIPAMEASMLNYLFPIMILISAVPINKEHINAFKIIAIVFGFLGTLIIVSKGNLCIIHFSNLSGDLLGIGAALCWGLFTNFGMKNKRDPYLSIYIYTLESFVLSAIGLFTFSRFVVPDVLAFSGLIWIGLTVITGIFFLWFHILKVASVSFAASMSFLNPFVSLLFIFLLIGEKILFIQLTGLAFIMIGVIVQQIGEHRAPDNRLKS